MNKIALGILSIIVLASSPLAFADSDIDVKLEFAGTLEETLGHLWALEKNLDENNAELALIHATHPIAELYVTMDGHLEANPEFSKKLEQTLLELKNNASTSVSRNDAQTAIDNARKIIQEARDIVIGDELSNDSAFKAQLITGLLETSKVEYMDAINNGEIIEMAEFQDGSAFIWRSYEIFKEIRSDVEYSEVVNDAFAKIKSAYDQKANPVLVSQLVDDIIKELVVPSGIESTDSKHMAEIFESDSLVIVESNEITSSETDEMESMGTDKVDEMESMGTDKVDEMESMGTDKVDEMESMGTDKVDEVTSMGTDKVDEVTSMGTDKVDEMIMTPLAPLKQINNGVQVKDVQCKSSLELIFKYSGEPACVKASSVQKLVSWGWTQ